jgi:hypothetical protein
MQATFLQKVILTAIAALAAAALIQFYKVFIKGADEAVSSGYNQRAGISSPK